MFNKKEYISWEEFHNDSKILSEKIKALNIDIKGIVAVTRGGLVPASIVSSELNIRKIEVYNIASYQGQQVEQIQVKVEPLQALADKGEGWIVVDELVDTGKTYAFIKENLPKAILTSVYIKNKDSYGDNLLNLYSKEKEATKWLCFPWEIKEEE